MVTVRLPYAYGENSQTWLPLAKLPHSLWYTKNTPFDSALYVTRADMSA